MQILRDVPLAPYTTFGIGGPADYFCKAESINDIIQAIEWSEERGLPFFILGSGANILVGDKGFRGLVIKNEASSYQFSGVSFQKQVFQFSVNQTDKPKTEKLISENRKQRTDNRIFLTADSGITIADLIKITAEKSFSGLEHFAGIPSTLGGALWQNLHFLSPDRSKTVFIGDIVEEAEILLTKESIQKSNVILASGARPGSLNHIGKTKRFWTSQNDEIPDGADNIVTVSNNYFNFGYDYSILHDTRDIVLSATLRLTSEDPAIIQQRIRENLSWRGAKHPENAVKTSAGSVFKKITHLTIASGVKEGGAGRFIDRVGLKGYQIGGARISEKHANFIINTGAAKASDVRALIDLVQKKVEEKFGLKLETEISFVGEF